MSKNARRYMIIAAAFALIVIIGMLPAPAGLTREAMWVLGIFVGVLILWLTVSIDWPSLVCVVLIGLLPTFTFKEILAGSFGGETVVFLFCTFLCTYALSQTPFLRRCALAMVTCKTAKKGPWQFAITFFCAVILIGCFMSPTVLFVIFLPILEEVYKVLGLKKGDKVAKMLMLGLVFCTSISAGMTPIAHIFSIMALGFYETATGSAIGYGSYMAFAIPVGIICVILMLLVFRFILRPDMSKVKSVDVSHLKNELPAFGKREGMAFGIFVLIICAWVLPSLLKGVFPTVCNAISAYGTAMPPMVGAVVLSILAPDGEPLLPFGDAMKHGIPWSSVIMSAGTLTIGSAMTNENIGLSQWLVDTLGPKLSGIAPLVLIFIIVLWAAVQTNLSSNMVTVTVVTAVTIPIMQATNGAINTAAVVCIIGMMAAYAFATPPAMPHVAIAGGTGWCSVSDLLKYGSLQMLIGVVIAVMIGYPIGCMVM